MIAKLLSIVRVSTVPILIIYPSSTVVSYFAFRLIADVSGKQISFHINTEQHTAQTDDLQQRLSSNPSLSIPDDSGKVSSANYLYYRSRAKDRIFDIEKAKASGSRQIMCHYLSLLRNDLDKLLIWTNIVSPAEVLNDKSLYMVLRQNSVFCKG